jgi:hypothetical protein
MLPHGCASPLGSSGERNVHNRFANAALCTQTSRPHRLDYGATALAVLPSAKVFCAMLSLYFLPFFTYWHFVWILVFGEGCAFGLVVL